MSSAQHSCLEGLRQEPSSGISCFPVGIWAVGDAQHPCGAHPTHNLLLFVCSERVKSCLNEKAAPGPWCPTCHLLFRLISMQAVGSIKSHMSLLQLIDPEPPLGFFVNMCYWEINSQSCSISEGHGRVKLGE